MFVLKWVNQTRHKLGMDTELHLHIFSSSALCFQWEKPKKNYNTCHVAPPHQIHRKMLRQSVGVHGFGNSLVSDAFSFSSSLLLCFFQLCFGCPLFFASQITRIFTMIPNTKVCFFFSFNFSPISKFSLFLIFFFGFVGGCIVSSI